MPSQLPDANAKHMPGPEEIAEACRVIREEGFWSTDNSSRQLVFRPPWSAGEYERRAVISKVRAAIPRFGVHFEDHRTIFTPSD